MVDASNKECHSKAPAVFGASDVEYSLAEPSPFQQRLLMLPEDLNLVLGGGRGGGKSVGAMHLMIKHCEKYGLAAKVLYIRETWESLEEFERDFANLVYSVYGKGVHHHKSDHLFTWPSGATVKMSQLKDEDDYKKFQGKSFTLLVGDEYGTYGNTKYFWLLASNMRAPRHVPLRIIILANPGGEQHGHVQYDFIEKGRPWEIYFSKGDKWCNVPSTLYDNVHIDHAKYIQQLRTACGNDEELLKAWISGDWKISRGAFFAGMLLEEVHKLRIPPSPPKGLPPLISIECPFIITPDWQAFIAHDWGSGVPSWTGIFAESPGVPRFPKGSLIIVDELATYDPTDQGLDTGLHWPPSKLAEGIKELCKPWGVFPQGPGDDAYGLEHQQTLLRDLAKQGVYLRKPDKERVVGWQRMCEMFTAARDKTGQPGLYVSERCVYWWLTVPYLQRDPKHPNDIMTKKRDHAADGSRYGVMHRGRGATSQGTEGMW